MSVSEFAAWARSLGFRWAALELDDHNNAPRWHDFRLACHSQGILAGPWFTNGGNVALTPVDADFTIAELEGPQDYDGIISALPNVPNIPRAIVTNFGSPLSDARGQYHPEKAKPLVDAGWRCLTECYISDNSNATPDNQDYIARKLGWPSSQPVFGTYGSTSLDYYKPWFGWSGWSVYLAEYLP